MTLGGLSAMAIKAKRLQEKTKPVIKRGSVKEGNALSKTVLSKKNKEEPMANDKPLITKDQTNENDNMLFYVAITSFLLALLALGFNFFLFRENSIQEKEILALEKKIEDLPKPISQGRLQLIIDKSKKEINESFGLILEKQTNSFETKISSIPLPVSSGKVNLMITKEVKQSNIKIENEIEDIKSRLINLKENLEGLPDPISAGKIGLLVSKEVKTSLLAIEENLTELAKPRNTSEGVQEEFEFINNVETKLKELEGNIIEINNKLSGATQEQVEDLLKLEIKKIKSWVVSQLNLLDELNKAKINEPLILGNNERNSFSDAAYKAIKADILANSGTGYYSFFKTRLKLLFAQRSLVPQDGDSVDAILSRVEDALQRGDTNRALSEIESLPKVPRDIMFEWREFGEEIVPR